MTTSSVVRGALAAVAVVIAAAVAGCDGDADRRGGGASFGLPCDEPSQCRTDAPLCVALTAPDYAPGVCASSCDAPADCPSGSECRSGACIRCAAAVAGMVASGG